jgi:hypothetical protein
MNCWFERKTCKLHGKKLWMMKSSRKIFDVKGCSQRTSFGEGGVKKLLICMGEVKTK